MSVEEMPTVNKSMLAEIRTIQQMTVDQLRAKWRELYQGDECRSRNRSYLVKRLCWRLQELRLGGLSDRARARIEELAAEGFRRATVPNITAVDADSASPAASEPKVVRIRDRRRLSVGTILTRQYHGQEVRVVALEGGGFEWDGRRFGSLSEVARAVTGQHWSGPLFFGLRSRSRKS